MTAVKPDEHERKRTKTRILTIDEYVEAIHRVNITILGQAGTIIESTLPKHYVIAQEIVEKVLP